MEAWPTSTSLWSMEQGRLGLCRARRRYDRSTTGGRTRRGPRSINADDSGSEEERAAGGAGPGAADPERTRIIGMAEVHGYIQWTSREPVGGVMNRLRCGRSSDSDGGSLHTDGPGQPTCQAASLDCSGWSEERNAGRARLVRVEGGDLLRTGPSRTTIQDVPLR